MWKSLEQYTIQIYLNMNASDIDDSSGGDNPLLRNFRR